MGKLIHGRLKLREAQAFIKKYHRHSLPLRRHKFSIGCYSNRKLVGVVTVDTPSSHGWSKYKSFVEIRRLCTTGEPNVGSFLLGKAKAACFAMGFFVVVSYTRPWESGKSYRAAGFVLLKYNLVRYVSQKIDGLLTWYCFDEPPSRQKINETKEWLGAIEEFLES